MINLLDIQPSVVGRDLKGKFICIYGPPKIGKTTFACESHKNLLLGFEHGWNAISGAYAINMPTWGKFKEVIKQLNFPDVQEKYNTITIDTVGAAWKLCEQYICQRENVGHVSDLAWGKGFAFVREEFEDCLRQITQLGYGLIIIAHAEEKVLTDDTEVKYSRISPAIPKQAVNIVNQLVDIIGCIRNEIDEETGQPHRVLYTRGNEQIVAGSRFKYLAPKIEFSYQDLEKAVGEAIEKMETNDDATIVDSQAYIPEDDMPYESIVARAKEIWTYFAVHENQEAIASIKSSLERVFHKPDIKLSEIQESQKDLYLLVLEDMEEIYQKYQEK